MDLSELIDREQIRQVMYKSFRAGDRRDKELHRSVFWDDAHSESTPPGEALAIFRPTQTSPESDARFRRNYDITSHYALNMIIDVQGDSAFAETYAITYHIVPADREAIIDVAGEAKFADLGGDASCRYDLTVGIRYNSRFEKRGGVWKIKIHRYIVDWVRFERHPEIGEGGAFLQHLRLRGTQDQSDASYEWFR